MTNQDKVLALFAEVNPIPDSDAFAELHPESLPPNPEGDNLFGEEPALDTHAAPRRSHRTPRSRGLVAAAVAAAVVLTIGIGTNWAIRSSEVSGSLDPTSTFTGTECVYEGPTEFSVGSEVTFAFLNASELTEVAYSIVHVPDGTTVEQIYDEGVFVAGTNWSRDAKAYVFPPTQRVESLTAPLDATGLYAVLCIDTDSETGHDYASLITVVGE